ncbi:MAG TPA: nucleotidyltransferase domain-containing protein [Thermoanaerobacterales bacterium]|nr:nucleotidyltransferase domain-containing protein [Thermoanaerobacterales bacterium]
MDIKQEITNLTNKIIEVTPAKKIYLFGSFAYGEPDQDSDIDLCIITKDSSIRKRDLIKSIRKSISKVATMPVDILLFDEEEFSKRAKLCSTIEYKIANEGVSIYGQ